MTLAVRAAMRTDVGCERDVNEDSGVIIRPADPQVLARRGVLAVVADGMGGHAAGEVASRLAVDVIHRSYYASQEPIGAALKDALLAANEEIFRQAQHEKRQLGMGTTCVALAVCGGEASIASVGDSRLYLIRGARIYQMTADDSAVAKLVKEGTLRREDARQHADRNVILRALGTHASVEVSGWAEPFPVRDDDVFVLCSDGLTDLVADPEILAAVEDDRDDGTAACASLVSLARERGGFDNITVAALRFTSRATMDTDLPVTREMKVT